jgi:hypothetical protein
LKKDKQDKRQYFLVKGEREKGKEWKETFAITVLDNRLKMQKPGQR